MSEKYDAIVIGTGQAGPSLAARLAGTGMTVAVIERKKFGGTCVNVGCIPTKTLVASARAAHVARRAADYGVVIDGAVRVDMKMVKARKDAIVAKSRTGVEKWLKAMENCTVYEGSARFEESRTVSANSETIAKKKALMKSQKAMLFRMKNELRDYLSSGASGAEGS